MLINKIGESVSEDVLDTYDRIVFWGALSENCKAVERLRIQNKVQYFVDIDEKKHKKEMDGIPVYSPSVLAQEDNVLVLTILARYAKDIIDSLQKHGKHECYFYIPEQNMKATAESNKKVLKEVSSPQYIHVFYDTVFLTFFYAMLEDHFCIDEHLFIVDMSVFWDDRFGILEFIYQKNRSHNNIVVVRNFGQLRERLSDDLNYNSVLDDSQMDCIFADSPRIILHSAIFSRYMYFFLHDMIQKQKGCGEKMVWICWDGDAYFDKDSFVVREILSNIGLAVTAKKHIERITSKCNIKTATLQYAPYGYIPKIGKQDIGNSYDGELRILLGHCAGEHCNHKLGFELLYPYCSKDIKIYCPLSYGSEIYKNHVIQEGYRLFGDKFIPVLDYMEPEQYYTFLDTIHIVLFPMTRMAGATTLSYCNASGKQIYMSREMIDAFSDGDGGIQADDLSTISDMSWEQFSSRISSSSQCDLAEVNQHVVSLWENIFDIGLDEK